MYLERALQVLGVQSALGCAIPGLPIDAIRPGEGGSTGRHHVMASERAALNVDARVCVYEVESRWRCALLAKLAIAAFLRRYISSCSI